ncbi:ABC-three component system middle component 1 [Mucilaginibacter sp. AW1-3]
MSNYSRLKGQVLGYLLDMFPDVEIQISEITYCGQISVVFIKSLTQGRLAEIWSDISNAVAIYYQTKLDTEFERWNLYLFYILESEAEKGLKYKIENDPVSSRKIVIDNYSAALDDTAMATIISQHITNTNLNITAQQPAALTFTKHVIIGPVIDAALASAAKIKGKSTLEINDLLTQIETRLKNEI